MKSYKELLRTYGLLIVILSVIGLGSGLVFTRIARTDYDVSLNLEVQKISQPNADFYTYDGFYSLQATELFSRSVANWFITPEFVKSTLQYAEVENLDDYSVSDFRSIFSSEAVSVTSVDVRFRTDTQEEAEDMTNAIRTTVQDTLEQGYGAEYRVNVGEAVVREHTYNGMLFSLIGLLIGALLGLIGMVIKEYFWE